MFLAMQVLEIPAGGRGFPLVSIIDIHSSPLCFADLLNIPLQVHRIQRDGAVLCWKVSLHKGAGTHTRVLNMNLLYVAVDDITSHVNTSQLVTI